MGFIARHRLATATFTEAIAHYAVRAIMADAATQAEIAPARLSFVQSVELIRIALDDFHLVAPADHARLYQRLLRDIAACRLPSRARRTNPRVVKRKMSKFALKRGNPAPPSQQLVAFETTVQILPQTAPEHEILDHLLPLDGAVDTVRSVPCLICSEISLQSKRQRRPGGQHCHPPVAARRAMGN